MNDSRAVIEITPAGEGEYVAINIPREMADRVGLHAGETAYALETDGGILLVPGDTPLSRVLDADARISQKYENALRELAGDQPR
jgi:hypothetical protein